MSAALAGYDVYLEVNGFEAGDQLFQAWRFFFAALVAMWAVEDSKRFGVRRHLGFGLIVLIFWPIVLLYHLPKTRGFKGLVNYAGFWGLYTAPFLFGLVAYSYS